MGKGSCGGVYDPKAASNGRIPVKKIGDETVFRPDGSLTRPFGAPSPGGEGKVLRVVPSPPRRRRPEGPDEGSVGTRTLPAISKRLPAVSLCLPRRSW